MWAVVPVTIWIGALVVLFWSTLYTAQRPRPVLKSSGMFIKGGFMFERLDVCPGRSYAHSKKSVSAAPSHPKSSFQSLSWEEGWAPAAMREET